MQHPTANPKVRQSRFVSLRLKLLVGFTVVYSIAFAMAYGWFYRYSNDRAMQRIEQDLVNTIAGTVAGIDPEEFQTLAAVEVPPGQILPLDHPLYQKHQEWLRIIHQIEPRANPYTFIRGTEPYEMLFIGDFLRISHPDSPTHFRESYIAHPAKTRLYQGFSHLTVTLTPYQDQWGAWVSAYQPIKNKQGQVIGGVGIDFQANYVIEVQQGIRQHLVITFSTTYIILFILVYIISGIIIRPTIDLVVAIEHISEGDYDQTLSPFIKQRFSDEISILAGMFERMVEKIRRREEELQEYNQSLERKVERRTEELQTKNTQLANANSELARATRLKDEFLANMSHELRTPLNAILGMTEGLQDQIFGSINEQQARALKTIDQSGYHLLELINDILDIAKIEADQLDLNCVSTDVALLCQASLTFIKQQALAKCIRLETKLPLNLPQVLVDERRIRQVLINLLSNAVKFTSEGGHVTLEVICPSPLKEEVEGKNFLRIAVIDTGIGIAAKDIPKLFHPFTQIDSALNRQYEGTGLGLALVKRLVELHHGQVGVSSKVGVGSCFTIDLPCSTPLPSSPEASPFPQCNIEHRQLEQQDPPLILLAENSKNSAVTISGYLTAKGYRVVLANDGESAISLAETEHPDLILMDLQMPGIDGLEAIKQLRLKPHLSDVPIITLTALTMQDNSARCLAAGANEYLNKPIKLKYLATIIERLVGSRDSKPGKLNLSLDTNYLL